MAPMINSTKDKGPFGITVEWLPLEDFNGYPYKYHIFYREKGINEYMSFSVNASQHEANISIPKDYTKYEIRIAAATVVGVGNWSEKRIQRSGEGGKGMFLLFLSLQAF